MLWSCCELLADQAYDDIEEFGDEPVNRPLPLITWRQEAGWRRQAARASDDLAGDLASGKWPMPRCAGEEVALHLVLRTAKDTYDEEWASTTHVIKGLLEHKDDFPWMLLSDVLFQDHDILDLFDKSLDGIEEPEADRNARWAWATTAHNPGSCRSTETVRGHLGDDGDQGDRTTSIEGVVREAGRSSQWKRRMNGSLSG